MISQCSLWVQCVYDYENETLVGGYGVHVEEDEWSEMHEKDVRMYDVWRREDVW